jgi:hypothetical protein
VATIHLPMNSFGSTYLVEMPDSQLPVIDTRLHEISCIKGKRAKISAHKVK